MLATKELTLSNDVIATQWMDHGDHPEVQRLNGHNWEHFPNESDKGCGLLGSCQILVHTGDWILYSKFFKEYRVVTSEEFDTMSNL